MPTFFHKPENALKRASEFIEVGKEESALEVLNDIIRSRKHRHKWTQVHEMIMLQFTKLCVNLQRSLFAKDGLYQYRNICKEVAPHSFEKVVNHFLSLAEDTAGKARQESEATALQEVEDLDVVMTPESLLLSTVSGEGAKERTDRVVLTPWVKFLWESYRNMLELLKNNPTSLSVYTEVAKKAFDFCLNYQRRTEFRKLCEILRNHLIQAEKYQAQTHSLKLDMPENIQYLVDIRFKQLESSITVDLWQEAFRAIEEIHKLLSISGKAPKASLLENFYSRQARVYMMAKNQLFHAAALHKLFVLRKEQKKTLTKEEEQNTASQVLLATLCIPIEPVPSETDRFLEVDDNSRDKAERLAKLLRMNTPPTRASLMKDVLKLNMLGLLPAQLQQLYQFLEVEFNPLHLCRKVTPILEQLEQQEHCVQYVDLLKQVMLVRLIKQVSQVYESITLSRLVELSLLTNTTELEKVVVETASSNNIQVHIDHRTKSLCFGTNLSLSLKPEAPEGPHVQSMPSEILCNQLTTMTHALQQAVRIISAPEIRKEHLEATKRTYQDYQVHCRGDHRKLMQRSHDIETRKEFIESRHKEKERKLEDQRKKKVLNERLEEKKRLEREAKERENQRKKQELEEMQLKIKQEKVDALKNTAVGKRAFADITNEELKQMDADLIFSRQLRQIEKEKRDKEIKLKTQEKKVDYFERAKRVEEIPLLEKDYESQRETDKKFHEDQEKEKVAKATQEHKEAKDACKRLNVMREDAAVFQESLQERRHKQWQESMDVFQVKLEEAKVERLAKRKKERMQRRKAEEAEARKEEAARLAKQQREEEEKRLEEERRRREAEREEEKRKKEEEEAARENWRRDDEEGRDRYGGGAWRGKDDRWKRDNEDMERGGGSWKSVGGDDRWKREDDKKGGRDERWRAEEEESKGGRDERWRREGEDKYRREGGEEPWRRDGGRDNKWRRDGDAEEKRKDGGGEERWKREGGGGDDKYPRDRWRRDGGGGGDDRWRRDGGGDDRWRRDGGGGGDDRWRRDGGGGGDRWRSGGDDRYRRGGGDDRWRRDGDDRRREGGGEDRWRRDGDDRRRDGGGGEDRWRRDGDDRRRDGGGGEDRWRRDGDDRRRDGGGGEDRWRRDGDDRRRDGGGGEDRWRRDGDDRRREGGGEDRWRREGGGEDRWRRDGDDRRREGGSGEDRWRRDGDDRRREGGSGEDRWRRDGDDRRREGGSGEDRWRRDGDDRRREGGSGEDRWRRDGR